MSGSDELLPLSQDSLSDQFAHLAQQFYRHPYPDLPTRRRWLHALAEELLAAKSSLTAAVSADFGYRSQQETGLLELFPALEGIRHARRHLRRWMRPQSRPTAFWFWPASNRVLAQPLGVVGIIVPWNYPLYLAIGPLVDALAAGNRVMIKMSELTPQTGQLLSSVLERALGSDVVVVVNGPVAVAEQFTKLPFDHLLFTGSTGIGRKVMQAASANLTPVTLELGGKSPCLVAPDARLAPVARAIVTGKMMNAGQTCVAPDYVLVPRSGRSQLVRELERQARRQYPRLADNPDYTAIINQQHLQRLTDWCERASAAGAEVLRINPAEEALAAVGKFPLTLVWNCPVHCQLVQQEIFGPILLIVEYDSIDQAIDHIRQGEKPLALYLFSHDKPLIARVLQQTLSGGVVLNETMLHVVQDSLPFGGVGASGMGHYHGQEGFLTFSKAKPIFRQARCNGRGLLRPPYGWFARLLLRFMLRK